MLVEEGGFLYDSDAYNDELPYWVRVGDRPHLIVPYSLGPNDVKFGRGTLGTSEDYFTYVKDGFDVLYREGRRHPKMMSCGLHLRLIGHPSRSGARARARLHHEAFGVWICRRIEIAPLDRDPPVLVITLRMDFLFDTRRFNLSEPKPHFINPSCFGEDLAAWLRSKLIERGIPTIDPGQEDWGWYIEATLDERAYFIGIGGNADEPGEGPNDGEWRITIERHRRLLDKITGRNKASPDEPMFGVVEESCAPSLIFGKSAASDPTIRAPSLGAGATVES